MLQPLQNIRETSERIIAGKLDERIVTDHPDDELGRLARAINEAFDRHRDAIFRQQRFASDASHQLRTPLTAIRATGEVCLQKDRAPEEYRETIGSMLEEVQHLSDLVEKLLMLARLGPEHVRRAFAPVELGSLIRATVMQYETIAAAKNIRIAVETADRRRVLGDAALLQQMTSNLIDNALRHTPDGGLIRVEVKTWLDTRAAMFVRDNGPGVAPELRANLFQRFARGPGADTAAGSGLGLAIVSDIVSLHNATIELLDQPGANFRILFPGLPAAS
jgi:signal transduction histidine kinase